MKYTLLYQHIIQMFVLFFLVFLGTSYADCSCVVGANGVNIIGLELVATRCPIDPPSDDQVYIYLVNPIRCEGTAIRNYSTYGDTMASPRQLIAFYVSQGYRVLRNPSGTHLIVVQRGRYPFSGFVSGVDMSAAAAGVYHQPPLKNSSVKA